MWLLRAFKPDGSDIMSYVSRGTHQWHIFDKNALDIANYAMWRQEWMLNSRTCIHQLAWSAMDS